MRTTAVALFCFLAATFLVPASSQAGVEITKVPDVQCGSLRPAACLKKVFGNCDEPCVLPASDGGWSSDWALIEKAVKRKVRIRFVIDDRCDSFCALFAEWMRHDMPDRICIAPGASLGYHRVADVELIHGQWVIQQRYSVQHNDATEKWLKEHGGETDEPKRIPYADLVAMGIWPTCKPSDPKVVAHQ